MTFHFFNWTQAFSATALEHGAFRARRPRLVACWRRGTDGKLECRWKRASYT